ncbi:MAG: hypothetical protein Q9217_006663 [Psora testacea]
MARAVEPNYITQLESRLKLLEEHHRGCRLNTSKPTLLQSPPTSPNGTDEGPEPSHPSCLFVQWELPTVQDALQSSKRPRWKQEADILLKEIPKATTWIDAWERYQGQDVITTVLGDPIPDFRSDATSSASTALVCHSRRPQNDLLIRVSKYAEKVKSCGAAAEVYTHIVSFQELVFVSLCVILVEYGIDTDVVDDIMRICISDSSSKNLRRLRAGALWAMVNNHGILVGKGIAQYARFAESFENSHKYFARRLIDDEYTKGLTEAPGWRSFSIPVFVRKLSDNKLKDSLINYFLGYSVTAPSPEALTVVESGKARTDRNRKRTTPDPGMRSKRSRRSTNTHHPRSTANTTSSLSKNSDCTDYVGISTNDQLSEPTAQDKESALSAVNQQAAVTPLWSSSLNSEQTSDGIARATTTDHSTLLLDWDTTLLNEGCATTPGDDNTVLLDWDNFLNNAYTTTSGDPFSPLDCDMSVGTLPTSL